MLRGLINFKYIFQYPESQICSNHLKSIQKLQKESVQLNVQQILSNQNPISGELTIIFNLFKLMKYNSIYYKLIMFLYIISSKIIYLKWQDHLQFKKQNISFSKKLYNCQINKLIDYSTIQKQSKYLQTEKRIENLLKKLQQTYKTFKRTQSFINIEEDWRKDQKYKKRNIKYQIQNRKTKYQKYQLLHY
ncbi:unnamed protein product [Paramecium primaurelia]|uniref:Transmembrane protein n=1 Tax=Paramecium primaurelia TaxID=5886 RepID=A0A8S1JSX2_PARPR|nr:unnamed protein product [Paramecium primaurelia]